MKQRLKRWIFRLLGKDPDSVVVTFCYAPVTAIAALTPLAACAVLWGTRSVR
jgi:hypothetical protein